MNAMEFASLLHAKSLRRGHWIARCPAHGDKRPSLSIAEGRKQPIVFRCMSQGCTQSEVMKAMGLTWKDLMGERPQMSREATRRLRDEQELRTLVDIRRKLISNEFMLAKSEMYDGTKAVCIEVDLHPPGRERLDRMIRDVRERLYPEQKTIRDRSEKTYRFVQIWGWDRLWELFLAKESHG